MNKPEMKDRRPKENSLPDDRATAGKLKSPALSQMEKRREVYASFGYDIEKERLAIIRAAGPLSGRILEAGTGKGHFAAVLAGLGCRLISFDISDEQLQMARENLAARGLDRLVELKKEDGEKLSFPDGYFDAVFSVNMVHHLENPWKVISELIRVLSPGGKLVISDFSPEGMEMMDRVHRLEGGKHEVAPVGLGEVEDFLSRSGFRIEKFQTRFQVTLVASRK